MHFSRRAEGVQASRKVFLRGRRWHGCSWQVKSLVLIIASKFGIQRALVVVASSADLH